MYYYAGAGGIQLGAPVGTALVLILDGILNPMYSPRRQLMSVALGASLGLCTLATFLVALTWLYPSWPRLDWLPGKSTPSPSDAVLPAAPTALPLPTAPGACGGPERMIIALLGVDERSAANQAYRQATRTDAIMLLNVNLVQRTAAVLSFPRDLYVPLPNADITGVEQDRINTAYLYGEIYGVPGGGPAEFKATMEWNFGLRVDRYVLVNFGAFVTAIDALGGIEVDVPDAIYDPAFPGDSGDGVIVFTVPVGRQHMDGATALRYARTRHQDDDYHRLQRQQLVLLAIRDKLLSPEVLPKLPTLWYSLQGLVRTDLRAEEIAALLCVGPRIDRQAIASYVIDGSKVLPWTTPQGGSVSIPNRQAIAPVVQAFLEP